MTTIAKTLSILIGLGALTGSTATFAQPMSAAEPPPSRAEMSQDRAQMAQNTASMKQYSRRLAVGNSRLRALKMRLRHETGDRRAADLAEIAKMTADNQAIRDQTKALGVAGHTEHDDFLHDRTVAPH